MTNMDPVMEPIFTKMIPCPGVGILKMIPCPAARPRTEKFMSTPPPGLYHMLHEYNSAMSLKSAAGHGRETSPCTKSKKSTIYICLTLNLN